MQMMSRWFGLALLALALLGCGGGGSSGDAGSATAMTPTTGGAGGGSSPPASGGGSGGSTPGGSGTGGTGTSGTVVGSASAIGTFLPAGGVEVFAPDLAPLGLIDVAIGGTGSFFGLDVAIGGTGAIIGSIQGFGSVIVNDQTLNTDNAEFSIEGVAGTQADLSEGQQVLVAFDADTQQAAQVRYRSNVKGPVTSVTVLDAALGRATLTVLGQTVRTNAATLFANADLATLAANDLVEVSGNVNQAGEIIATFVERDASISEFKVTGSVANVSGSSFTLAGLTVDAASAMLIDFDDQPLAAGQAVEVRAAPAGFSAPATLAADVVERLPRLLITEDAELELEGRITRFVSASDFDVVDRPVTTNSGTVFVNGDATTLALGKRVEVEGRVNLQNVLVADRVVIKTDNAIRLEGPVDSVNVQQSSVRVLGVDVSLRPLTRLEDDSDVGKDPLTLADIGIGERLEIRGFLDGETVVASRIERENADDRVRLRGPVSAVDGQAGTLAILGVALTTASGTTEYEDTDEATITAAQFFAAAPIGQFVTATWDVFVSTGQPVDKLALEADDD